MFYKATPPMNPESVFHEMFIYRKQHGVVRGRSKPSGWEKDEQPIRAAITTTSAKEVDRWKQRGHEVSHTIVHPGPLKAKEGDKFVYGCHEYTIEGLKDAAKLGAWSVYYTNRKEAEENVPETLCQ